MIARYLPHDFEEECVLEIDVPDDIFTLDTGESVSVLRISLVKEGIGFFALIRKNFKSNLYFPKFGLQRLPVPDEQLSSRFDLYETRLPKYSDWKLEWQLSLRKEVYQC